MEKKGSKLWRVCDKWWRRRSSWTCGHILHPLPNFFYNDRIPMTRAYMMSRQIKNYELQITNYKLQIANYKLKKAKSKLLTNNKLRIANTNYRGICTWHGELILVVVLLDRIDVWLCQTKSLVPGPKQQGKLYAWTTASLNLIQCKLDKKITSVLVFVRMGEVTTEELATLQREFDWLLSQEVLRLVDKSNHCCCW